MEFNYCAIKVCWIEKKLFTIQQSKQKLFVEKKTKFNSSDRTESKNKNPTREKSPTEKKTKEKKFQYLLEKTKEPRTKARR